MDIRDATPADLEAVNDIYNYEVENGISTFDIVPMSLAERRAWLEEHDPRRPVIVCVEDGRLVGWASISAWSTRCAYARAGEVSIYVARDARGRGVGKALLQRLIDRARAVGLGVLLARIAGDGGASLRLHEALGFQRIGTMRRVGEKFGRILDVQLLDLHLDG